MVRTGLRCSLFALVLGPLLFACAQVPDSPLPLVDYASQVQPLLEQYCYQCHGGDVRAPSGRLRLHSEQEALAGGRSGEPAIVRGYGEASPLLLSINGRDPEAWRKMPPVGYPAPTREETRLIERWIDEGAPWPGAD